MASALKSPQHKLACRALYKAFLSHCRKLPCPKLQQDAVKHVVKQFKKNKKIQAIAGVQQVLYTAYKHEVIMRRATRGDQSCVDTVREHLEKLNNASKPPPPPPPRPRPRPPPEAPVLSRLEKARLKKIKIRARCLALGLPLPKKKIRKGPRIWQPQRYLIPILASANGLPLLRRRGEPTPQRIAVTIKNIIKVRQKRQDRVELLEEHLEHAKGEDIWDSEIGRYMDSMEWPSHPHPHPHSYPHSHTETAHDEYTWEAGMTEAIKYITDAMRRRDEKSVALTNKFWDIELEAREKSKRIIQGRRRERRKRARHNRGRRNSALKQFYGSSRIQY